MVVAIDFFGKQRSLAKTGKIEMKLPEHSRISDVLKFVKDKYPEIPLSEDNSITVTVNQKIASLNSRLKDRDHVSFLPHIGGG
jgi:molybdopterin converting factor small subunit